MAITTVSPGITRIELDNRKGYLVRLSRNGERVNQYYSDSVNGGKRKALKLAKQARADLLAEYGPVEHSTKGVLTNRNTTGVVGVHLAYSKDNRYEDCEYSAYCASWISESGGRSKISFSFNKYGEDAAFDLAVLARKEEISDRDTVVAKYARTAKGKRNLRAAGKKSVSKATSKKSKKLTKKSKKLSKKSIKKSAKKSAKKPARKTARKTAKKVTKKAAKKSARKAAKKSTKKSTKKSAKKAARKSVKKSARKKARRR